MKLMLIVLFWIFVGLMVIQFSTCTATKLANAINSQDSTWKSYIGKSVVIKSDTETIVNYSQFNNTFTLSNGVKVDTAFYCTHKTK